MDIKIPIEVKQIIETLSKAGFKAYIVGGCVRDLLRKTEPKDWDVATNAKPEEIQKLFPDSFYENEFGTVGIKTEREDPALKVIEATTFRIEEKYTDKRHPDSIKFAETVEEDLARRDFTINAMALEIQNSKVKNQNYHAKFKVIDPFNGQEDLQKKLIKAVGDPGARFQEDALRLLRAIRFATILGFKIEQDTFEAIKKHAGLILFISKERIRDELIKIIEEAKKPSQAFFLMHATGLLKHILPELEEGWGVSQNKHHIWTVFEHNVYSLDYAVRFNYPFLVRLAALLHDVGKPKVKQGEGPEATFYGHEMVGAKMAAQALSRLKFPKEAVKKIWTLVRYHLFYYNVGEVTERSVRRLVSRVGLENMEDLVRLRIAERKGSGVPKAEPYKLRHFRYMVEKVSKEPISLKMLATNGDEVMKVLGISPGRKVGWILKALFDEVLDDPSKNKKEYLLKRMQEIAKLSDEELKALAEAGERKAREIINQMDQATKKKYWVE